jgi:O-antigen/teichoic acid export membrane protein
MDTVLTLRRPGSRLIRDVVTTYAGFFANAVFGFVTLRLLAMHMGPGNFGVTALANLFMAVIAGLGEPGIGTALVRLASQPAIPRERVDELVVAAIRLKLLFLTALCAVTYLLLPWITTQFMHRPELTRLLRACLGGGALLSLATFAGALFQIRGAFRENAASIALAGAVRTVAVVGLWGCGRLTLRTAVGSMILMNVAQFGICLFALLPMLRSLPWGCWDRRHPRELVSYTKYLVVWVVAGTIHPRADTLLLTHFTLDNRVLGFYSAAAQLGLVVPMLTQSINLVLLPRISAQRSAGEMRGTLRHCCRAALVILALLVPVEMAAQPIVRLVFGSHYGPAVPLFRILLLAAAAELALNPLSNFWHALNRPAMLSILNIVRLSLLVSVAAVAIPRFGEAGRPLGAAVAVLVSTVLALGGQGALLWAMVREGRTMTPHRPTVTGLTAPSEDLA